MKLAGTRHGDGGVKRDVAAPLGFAPFDFAQGKRGKRGK